MSNRISSIRNIQRQHNSRILLKNSLDQSINEHPNNGYNDLSNKNPSLISVDHQQKQVNSDHNQIREKLKLSSSLDHVTVIDDNHSVTKHERPYSFTQMLLTYAQQDLEIATKSELKISNDSFNNILNVLELHFNTYANDKHQIYFEGIFQILHDFKEQITEFILTETMKSLQVSAKEQSSCLQTYTSNTVKILIDFLVLD